MADENELDGWIYGSVAEVFRNNEFGAIGVGHASADGGVAYGRRMNGPGADALLEQRRVLTRQVVHHFVVSMVTMLLVLVGVFVAQAEDRPPEIRSGFAGFQVRQFGRHRRQHRP